MILRQLTTDDIRPRLKHGGLFLQTGPFVVSIRTPIAVLADAITTLYADFPVVDGSPFADFHLEVAPRRGLRRWVRPQATFALGGSLHHDPFRLPLAPAFFEWGFNGCIFRTAHHYLVLHGAVVERDGRALVLLGRTGSGKSTLCAALTISGWRLLSDELTMIVPGTLDVVPLPRPMSLKNDSIAVVRGLAPDVQFGPITRTVRKGLIAHMRPPRESVQRMSERAEASQFLFVRYEAGSPTTWRPIAPGQALIELARQSFNYGILGRRGFEHLALLVDRCPAGTLTYGDVCDVARALDRDGLPRLS